MRIGINASFLRKPNTGIGQVTMHFLRCLIDCEGMNRVFARHYFFLYLEEDIDLVLPENFEKRAALPFWKRDDLARKWLWETKTIPRLALQDRCNGFLSLYQSATVFPKKTIKHEMIIHDIIPVLFPEYLNTWRKRWYQRSVEKGIAGADTLLSVSKQTEKDLIRCFGISPQKIHIAHIDVDPLFSNPVSYKENIRVLKKYALDPGYLYYGGGLETRKNVSAILSAYEKILRDHPSSFKRTVIPDLVISGELLPQLSPLVTDVEEEVRRRNLKNYVHILGRVDQKDLPALYANAKIFLFPSRYEGFGMPVLEAMRMGVPVITSKRSSLPEVAGDAALYCDPDSPFDMARTMMTLLERKELRETLSRRGKERARKFSWKSFTEKVMSHF